MTRQLFSRPEWVPEKGHCLRRTGVHFDAVCVSGPVAEEAADALAGMSGGEPGPVVRETREAGRLYFLLPPGTACARRWPPGAVRLGGRTGVGYVGVPALDGRTWPLSWRSAPTPRAPFVDPALLHTVLCEALHSPEGRR
ncbi:hypothetical protein ACFW9F_06030 [Streptomyces sp. NPDC059506]|uniref:hypothetical protein n=1 Tax=Streptomyces sp. NPDC059506 TaxID=3347751 RepID=UPI003674EFB8